MFLHMKMLSGRNVLGSYVYSESSFDSFRNQLPAITGAGNDVPAVAEMLAEIKHIATENMQPLPAGLHGSWLVITGKPGTSKLLPAVIRVANPANGCCTMTDNDYFKYRDVLEDRTGSVVVTLVDARYEFDYMLLTDTRKAALRSCLTQQELERTSDIHCDCATRLSASQRSVHASLLSEGANHHGK